MYYFIFLLSFAVKLNVVLSFTQFLGDLPNLQHCTRNALQALITAYTVDP